MIKSLLYHKAHTVRAANPGSPPERDGKGHEEKRNRPSNSCSTFVHFVSFVFKNGIILSLLLSSCAPLESTSSVGNLITPLAPTAIPAPTSGRSQYGPGELVDYHRAGWGYPPCPRRALQYNNG